MDKNYYEFVVTAGEGTLIDFGVCVGLAENWDAWDLEGIAYKAAVNGHNVQFEICSSDCETGK